MQKPGGLGPVGALQPLGGEASLPPSAYALTPETVHFNRVTGLDNLNRVFAQYSRDRGEAVRNPVGPTNYQEGNIMPSAQITGLAGYQHRDPMVMPGRAADLAKDEYLTAEQMNMDPNVRAQLQLMTVSPQQNFYNTQDISTSLLPSDYRLPSSLPLQRLAGQRGGRRG